MSRNHRIRSQIEKQADAGITHNPEELTGPEAAAEAAGTDFVDDDLDAVFGPQTDDPVHGEPEEPQAEDKPGTQQITIPVVDGLAKQYMLKAYESLQRTPSPNLGDSYRASLLHMRELVNTLHARGVKSIGKMTAAVITVLAQDQRGKIDAVNFLRQLMRQCVWTASVDVSRARRAEQQANPQRRFGEEDERTAPLGMQGMTDHSDAIAGVRGDDEIDTTRVQTERGEVTISEANAVIALEECNGFLSTFADYICDDENDRLYLGLDSGLPYLDKPGVMAGSWVGVYDVDEALDIQLIKNQETMVKRDRDRAQRRAASLEALGNLLDRLK